MYDYSRVARDLTKRKGSLGHFTVSRDWVGCGLRLAECAVLGHLLALGRSNADGAGWLQVSPSHLARGVGAEGEDALESLVRLGRVEVQSIGGRRHVRVLLDRLFDSVQRQPVRRRLCDAA